MQIDKRGYKRLCSAYNNAVILGLECFVFQGQELLTAYAKHLIDYLGTKEELK